MLFCSVAFSVTALDVSTVVLFDSTSEVVEPARISPVSHCAAEATQSMLAVNVFRVCEPPLMKVATIVLPNFSRIVVVPASELPVIAPLISRDAPAGSAGSDSDIKLPLSVDTPVCVEEAV